MLCHKIQFENNVIIEVIIIINLFGVVLGRDRWHDARQVVYISWGWVRVEGFWLHRSCQTTLTQEFQLWKRNATSKRLQPTTSRLLHSHRRTCTTSHRRQKSRVMSEMSPSVSNSKISAAMSILHQPSLEINRGMIAIEIQWLNVFCCSKTHSTHWISVVIILRFTPDERIRT